MTPRQASQHAPIEPDAGAFMHPPPPAGKPDRDIFGNPPPRHRDWSHRRGEPRVMALLWMVYLMSTTVLMFSSMAHAYSISPDITRPAARSMLTVVVVGFAVLWPMIRCSQRIDSRDHVWFAFRDAVVIFVPMQAVLWPQALPILASWSLPVIAAVSALCLVWLLVLAGALAMAMGSIQRAAGRELVRVSWMLVMLAIVFAAPVLGSVRSLGVQIEVDQPRVGWLLSPITGVLELVRDRRELGTAARVFPEHWRMILAIACVGIALLLIARAIEVARNRYDA